MSRYRRSLAPGATFFFTVNTLARQPVLTASPVRQALREAIAEVRLSAPFIVHAWVLLPDHLHCIWELPAADADYGTRWSIIKRRVTQARAGNAQGSAAQRSASRMKRREGAFWQRRFWEHQIRDDNDFVRHVDYIHYNPVKHGHAKLVSDWPYSTFHRFVKEGVYARDWAGASPIEQTGDFGE